MIEIHQVQLTDELYRSINSNEDTPEVHAYRASKFGEIEEAERLGMFAKVAEVATDSLEEAFDIMNRFSEEDLEKITKVSPYHSMSVGDIAIKDGVKYLCASVGFKEIGRVTRKIQLMVTRSEEWYPVFEVPAHLDNDEAFDWVMEHYRDDVYDEYQHKYTYDNETSCDFSKEIDADNNTVEVSNWSSDDQELLRSFS